MAVHSNLTGEKQFEMMGRERLLTVVTNDSDFTLGSEFSRLDAWIQAKLLQKPAQNLGSKRFKFLVFICIQVP